jgi:two-component system OmpR family response regulator
MERAPHLLVVDDDRELRDLLSKLLGRRGYKVSTARSEPDMWNVLETSRVDLIVLDVMLPGRDGLAICRELRATVPTPVLMLSAKGDPTDRVVGLEIGADDYLAKPFDVHELEARIKAVLRRAAVDADAPAGEQPHSVSFAGWTLNLRQRQLFSPDGVAVDLTSGEFDILVVFTERPQRVLTRSQLLDLARGRNATPFDRSIDVQVSRLRKKLEVDPKKPEILKTVRGDGYIFTPPVVRE